MRLRNFAAGFLIMALAVIWAGCSSFSAGDWLAAAGMAKGASGDIGSSDDRQRAAGGCSGASPFTGSEVSEGGASRSRSRGQGEAVHVDWPSDEEWDGYGLKGLRQPAGSTVTNVALYQGAYFVSMVDAGKDAYNDMIAQIKRLTGVKNAYSLVKGENSEMSEYQWGDHYVQLVVEYVEMELIIRVLR
jgi:hypothetical protein